MPAAKPWTAQHEQTMRAMHADGASLNAIARELHRSPATIHKRAKDAGLSWDRTTTAAATQARQADAKDRRSRLELLLLADAEKLRGQIWEPHEYIDHGGKEFVEVRWRQDEPSPVDKLKLMSAAGTAIGASLKIATHDSDTGAEQVKSLLGGLAAALGLPTGGHVEHGSGEGTSDAAG